MPIVKNRAGKLEFAQTKKTDFSVRAWLNFHEKANKFIFSSRSFCTFRMVNAHNPIMILICRFISVSRQTDRLPEWHFHSFPGQ